MKTDKNIQYLPAGVDGRKTAKYKLAYYKDGKRFHKNFNSLKEAKSWEKQLDPKQHIPASQAKTIKEAYESWMSIGLGNREPSTIEDYVTTFRLHITPYLGDVKITDLDELRVMEFVTALRKDGKSNKTIFRTLVTLRIMLSRSARTKLVTNNIIKDMKEYISEEFKFAERMTGDDDDDGLIEIPTPAEIEALTKALPTLSAPVWRPLFLTAILTGMRISELLGLRWENVDLEAKTISVRQKIDRNGNPGPLKNTASKRTVPIPDELAEVLGAWKAACPPMTMEQVKKPYNVKGDPPPPPRKLLVEPVLYYVFPTRTGEAQTRNNARNRGLIPAWIAAGVISDQKDKDGNPKAKYSGHHVLRHFATSWMINPKSKGGRGIEPIIAMKHLGHTDLKMIEKVYGHAFDETDASRQELNASARKLMGMAE